MKYSSLLLLIAAGVLLAKEPSSARHVVVYKEPARYAGWPANHGIWQWGNEILVGFEVGHVKTSSQYHAIDYERPEEHVLARSKDGGDFVGRLRSPRDCGRLPERVSLECRESQAASPCRTSKDR